MIPAPRVYNRSQFKPIADDLIEICQRNATQGNIFDEEGARSIVKVEQIHRAYRLWWDNASLHINQAACGYLLRRAARSRVPVFIE